MIRGGSDTSPPRTRSLAIRWLREALPWLVAGLAGFGIYWRDRIGWWWVPSGIGFGLVVGTLRVTDAIPVPFAYAGRGVAAIRRIVGRLLRHSA
jgi:hypothetical protein